MRTIYLKNWKNNAYGSLTMMRRSKIIGSYMSRDFKNIWIIYIFITLFTILGSFGYIISSIKNCQSVVLNKQNEIQFSIFRLFPHAAAVHIIFDNPFSQKGLLSFNQPTKANHTNFPIQVKMQLHSNRSSQQACVSPRACIFNPSPYVFPYMLNGKQGLDISYFANLAPQSSKPKWLMFLSGTSKIKLFISTPQFLLGEKVLVCIQSPMEHFKSIPPTYQFLTSFLLWPLYLIFLVIFGIFLVYFTYIKRHKKF